MWGASFAVTGKFATVSVAVVAFSVMATVVMATVAGSRGLSIFLGRSGSLCGSLCDGRGGEEAYCRCKYCDAGFAYVHFTVNFQ